MGSPEPADSAARADFSLRKSISSEAVDSKEWTVESDRNVRTQATASHVVPIDSALQRGPESIVATAIACLFDSRNAQFFRGLCWQRIDFATFGLPLLDSKVEW